MTAELPLSVVVWYGIGLLGFNVPLDTV